MVIPSKKVLSFFILTASIVVFIIIYFGGNKVNQVINYTSTLTPGEKMELPKNTNWQNELSSAVKNTAPTESTDMSSTTNKTDTLSTTLMYNYLALKQNNSLNDESASKLVEQIQNYTTDLNFKQITASNLNIIKDSSKQAIADYGESLGMIFKNNKPVEPINELQILQEALSNQDPKKLEILQDAVEVYENIAMEMVKMKVPEIFTKAHVDMINGMYGTSFSLSETIHVFEDPIRGLQGIALYQQQTEKFILASKSLIIMIQKTNIPYKQGSGGYYLFYGI